MEVTTLSRYVCAAFNAVIGIPFLMILAQEWRFPPKRMRRMTMGYVGGYALCATVLYLCLGGGRACRIFIGIVPVVIGYLLYGCVSRYRKDRFCFTAVTAGLLSTMCDAFSCLLAPYGSPLYILVKLGCMIVLSVLLWLFRDSFEWFLGAGGGKGWARITLVPLVLWVTLLVAYVLPAAVGLWGIVPDPAVALCLCGAVPLCYMAFSNLVRSLRTEYEATGDTDILRSQVRALERQVERIQAEQEQGRIFRHDLRHYMSLLDAKLSAGDLDQARHILESMETTLAEHIDSTATLHAYTGDPLMDTVFSVWAERCAAAGVEFSVRLTLPETLRVDVTELAVVVGNALDNALNACRAMPEGSERAVRVYDSPGGGQFFLAIDNTYAGTLSFDERTGLPVSHRPGHGYGTKSIAAFAKRYGAVFSCSAENGWFRLRLLI